MNYLTYLYISAFNVIMPDGPVGDEDFYRPESNFISAIVSGILVIIFLTVIITLIIVTLRKPDQEVKNL